VEGIAPGADCSHKQRQGLTQVAFGVFIHRSDSIYDDVPSERYQFPRQYLSRAQQCEGDWIIYLEPSKVKDTKGYFAVAKVQGIISDPRKSDMYLAVIESGTYLDFGDPVPFRDTENLVERGLLNDEGRISGRAQAAVRTLSNEDCWTPRTTFYLALETLRQRLVFKMPKLHFNTCQRASASINLLAVLCGTGTSARTCCGHTVSAAPLRVCA